MALAKADAERNANKSRDKISEDQQRLEAAEANMRKMLERVNEETKNVESAIADLKQAQADMDGGVDDQLNSLKSGGLVKQATLVGTLLFTLRAGTDAVLFVGGDSSHLMPAGVQAVIAVVCFVAFMAI